MSFKDCIIHCFNVTQCTHFSYSSSNRICNLKNVPPLTDRIQTWRGGRRCGYIPDRIQLEENSIGGKLLAFMHGPCCGYSHSSLDINVLRPGTIHRKIINKYTVALCHLKWALKSANPLILEQPLKRTIEDNLFLLFFLSGWTKNK